jgi:hypothetical protein
VVAWDATFALCWYAPLTRIRVAAASAAAA